MILENQQTEDPSVCYRSGVAARLTGIPVETLRVWERRYRVAAPRLSETGQRLYSPQQIRRLAAIKQLVDLGHPIGLVAGLPIEALTSMRDGAGLIANRASKRVSTRASLRGSSLADNESTQELSIALIGPGLSSLQFDQPRFALTLKIAGRFVSVAECSKQAVGAIPVKADVFVIEMAIVNDQTLASVDALKALFEARWGIILYRFAPSDLIRRLRTAGYQAVRSPVDGVQIESLCRQLLPTRYWSDSGEEYKGKGDNGRDDNGRDDNGGGVDSRLASPPRPVFDEASLIGFTKQGGGIYCECPSHLAELVLSLTSFERYSSDCENSSPQDAVLHRALHRVAGQARALIEGALVKVAVAEGLPIPAQAALTAAASGRAGA